MNLGTRGNNVDLSPERSSNGGRSGYLQNDVESSAGHSSDGSMRRASSVISSQSVSSINTPSKLAPTSRRVLKALDDYARKLVNLDLFTQCLEDWVLENSREDVADGEQSFGSPFSVDELVKLDLALEGVHLQQLCRMPSSYDSDDSKEDEYLALEDFLYAILTGLWHTFWRKSGPLPYFLSCSRHPGSKFYTLEKAISRRMLEKLSGFALISKLNSDQQVQWDQVMEFALFRPDILSGDELKLSPRIICEALFYGFHMLVTRSLRKMSLTVSDSVFVLVFDSKFGGVVKLGGDLGTLEANSTNPYQSVTEWIKCHAEVEVSSVDRVWNKLGNANWRDVGTLQILLATFYSMVQRNGPPRKSIASLASKHNVYLQKRRIECLNIEIENAVETDQPTANHGEIEEVDQSDNPSLRKEASCLHLRQGEVLLLDDQRQGHKSFQIQDSVIVGNYFVYYAVCLDHPSHLLTLYVGAHPSRLGPSWEDMSLWYQVQRQTKVLNILKQQGVTSKYLPEIVASGKILHSGPCNKQSPGGPCDHPWCETPILVTSPAGKPLSAVVAQDGPLSPDEVIRCCRDCLAALRAAAMANVLHGDICPENVIRVADPQGARNSFLYMPVSWGRAVLEDKDSPAINLQFSSSHALQHGKLCPSSDAESLIYLLFYISGGTMQQQDSIESALQWRERSWAKRLIQHQLGEVSALLKAFADYVDSLCGTPYPFGYDIWLKRLNRAVDGSSDRGKLVEEVTTKLRTEDVAESSRTSGAGF